MPEQLTLFDPQQFTRRLSYVCDSYWDEITQSDDSVGGQPLNSESQIEKYPQKSVSGENENSDIDRLSVIEEKCEAPGDDCPPTIRLDKYVIEDESELSKLSNSCSPTIQVSDRIRDTSPLRLHDKEGEILEVQPGAKYFGMVGDVQVIIV